MKTLAIINQKGGSGKTTTAVNLGAALAIKGKKVLAVDMDPQAHLTQSLLGTQSRDLGSDVYDLLKGDSKVSEVVVNRSQNLSLIPSSLNLAAAEVELAGIPGKEFILKEAMLKKGFDYCFLDCPPSLGLLTILSLTAANSIIIPLQVEYLALDSLSKLRQSIDLVKKRLNRNLAITGVLATRFDKRKRLNREILDSLKKHFKDRVYKTMIRDNIALAEAPSYGKTIFEYKPRSYGAEDYSALAGEFLRSYNDK